MVRSACLINMKYWFNSNRKLKNKNLCKIYKIHKKKCEEDQEEKNINIVIETLDYTISNY